MSTSVKRPIVMDKEGQLRIEDQLCFALYSLSRAFTKQYSGLLKDMGITYPQYLALLVLWQGDGISIQQIASRMELEQPTTTPLIQRLEKLGFVSRVRSSVDERRVEVFLTTTGRKLFKRALDVPHQIGCATGLTQATAELLIKEVNAIKHYIESKGLD